MSQSAEVLSPEERTILVKNKLAEIDRLSQELFDVSQYSFTPLFPWVFVLVCQKEQKVGSIWTVGGSKQNKPMHEGIVLCSWGNKVVERGIIHKNGQRLTRCEIVRSEMSPGDHVLFHHYAGMPIWGWDTDRFRVVRETHWHEANQGGIVARLNYDSKGHTAMVEMLKDIWPHTADDFSPEEMDILKAQLDDRYVVVARDTPSVTLSGV